MAPLKTVSEEVGAGRQVSVELDSSRPRRFHISDILSFIKARRPTFRQQSGVVISRKEQRHAQRNPATQDFVQFALEQERQLHREGRIDP